MSNQELNTNTTGGDGTNSSSSELLGIYRKIISGEVAIKSEGRNWEDTFCGDVTFVTSDGHTLIFFNDCNELDYTDSVRFTDGRTADFDEWQLGEDPLNFLTDDEHNKLEDILSIA